MADRSDGSPNAERPHWVERLFGFLAGLILGPLITLAAAVFLVLMGFSLWFLLLPVAGLVVGPIVGVLFPKFAIDLFDGTSVFGRPLSAWVLDWVT